MPSTVATRGKGLHLCSLVCPVGYLAFPPPQAPNSLFIVRSRCRRLLYAFYAVVYERFTFSAKGVLNLFYCQMKEIIWYFY